MTYQQGPVQMYVSYLTTRELVASIERVERKLDDKWLDLPPRRRAVLQLVRGDLLAELGRRQVRLFNPARF